MTSDRPNCPRCGRMLWCAQPIGGVIVCKDCVPFAALEHEVRKALRPHAELSDAQRAAIVDVAKVLIEIIVRTADSVEEVESRLNRI